MLSCHKRHNFREAETKKEIMGGNQALTQSAILHQGTPRNLRTWASASLAVQETGKDRKPGPAKTGILTRVLVEVRLPHSAPSV